MIKIPKSVFKQILSFFDPYVGYLGVSRVRRRMLPRRVRRSRYVREP